MRGTPFSSNTFAGANGQLVSDEYDFMAREQHDGQGRWITPDPMNGTGNKYVYANNNPLAEVDPYGLTAITIDGVDFGGIDAEFDGVKFKVTESKPNDSKKTTANNTTSAGTTSSSPTSPATQTPQSQQNSHTVQNQEKAQPTQEQIERQQMQMILLIQQAMIAFGMSNAFPEIFEAPGPGSSSEAVAEDASGLQVTRWTAADDGPLSQDIARTFRGGSYTETVATEDTILFRAWGGTGKEIAGYWSRTAPTGAAEAKFDFALLDEWGITAEKVSSIKVPAGTKFYEGYAAPQTGENGQFLLGGGNQVYVPKVSPSWLYYLK